MWSTHCVHLIRFFFIHCLIIALGPMNSADRWSLQVAFWPLDSIQCIFSLLIIYSITIPPSAHYYFTVFVCHGRWWIRIKMELSPSSKSKSDEWKPTLLTAHTVHRSCQWINHESETSLLIAQHKSLAELSLWVIFVNKTLSAISLLLNLK